MNHASRFLRLAAAAAMIALCSFMDLGPAVGTANLAAKTAGIPPAVYFVAQQMPVAVWVVAAVAMLVFFSARYFDGRSDGGGVVGQAEPQRASRDAMMPPAFMRCCRSFRSRSSWCSARFWSGR